jgi:hypothetical protein
MNIYFLFTTCQWKEIQSELKTKILYKMCEDTLPNLNTISS